MTVVCRGPYATYVASTYSTDNQIIDSNNFGLDDIKNKFPSISRTKSLVENQLVYEPVVHECTMTVPNRKKENLLDNAYDIVVQTKPFLTTIPLSQMINKACDAVFFKRKHMRELCDKADFLLNYEFNALDNGKGLLYAMHNCVDACNAAKEECGINEDALGKFAFDLSKEYIIYKCQKAAFFFGLLKNYNKAILTEDGKMSSILPYKSNLLAESLNFAKEVSFCNELECSKAMSLFISAFWTINTIKEQELHDFVSFLYSGTQLGQEKYDSSLSVSIEDLKKDFLTKAFYFTCNTYYQKFRLLDIIELVRKIKKNNLLINERELGYYALGYEPTVLDNFASFLVGISYAKKKEKIALLCVLIEKYLKTTKIIPTQQDYDCYVITKYVPISFPDDFDSRLLDSEYVAFKEYNQLFKEAQRLRDAGDDSVEKCVKDLYPARNKLTLTTIAS